MEYRTPLLLRTALLLLSMTTAVVGQSKARFDERSESIAEEARQTPGVVPWIFDRAGGREEIVRPGSIFGAVGIERPLSEGFDPMQNAHGLGGLASQGSLTDRPSQLDLYGRNGLLVVAPEQFAIDTPITLLRWGRGGFSGNTVDLQFQRRLIDFFSMGLQVLSINSKPSNAWEYQNAIHQPFMSALGRDSSSIPFTGRALSIDTWEMIPWIQLQWRGARARIYGIFSENSSDEAPALFPIPDKQEPYTTLSWKEPAFHLERSTTTLGGELLLPLPAQTELKMALHSTERSTEWSALTPYVWVNNPFESLFEATEKEAQFDEKLLGGRAQLRSTSSQPPHLPLPSLRLDWEFRRSDQYPALPTLSKLPEASEGRPLTHLDEDRELGLIEWNPRLNLFSMETQWGWQRISTPADKELWSPVASTALTWENQLLRLNASGWWREIHPTLEQRYLFETGRLHFPNHQLQPQQSRTLEGGVAGKIFALQLEGGVRWEHSDDWIGGAGLEALARSPDSTLSDTLAFGWRNWNSAESFRWHLGAEWSLGNWDFGIRRYLTPFLEAESDSSRFSIVNLPNRHYAGHIAWKRKVLRKKNLDLSMRWDWHWIGERQEWRVDPLRNRAIRTEMKEWLALDFEARMRILDFQLFYRIRNMNHDQYFTAPGYTPTGITFQYGITWMLKG